MYDLEGRGIASINAKGQRWTTVYDLASRHIASVDPLGRRSSSVYNSVGAVIASINPAGNRSTSVYNLAGQTVASIDANGARSTTTYNADSQTVAHINALGFRTTSIYDVGGRGVASVAANGGRSTTVYDTVGRAAASVNPLGKRWTTVYNTVGQTVGSKDPLGNRSTSVFDSAGRVVAIINPLGKRTTTVYNIASQNLATVDANGQRVSSVYDRLGRRTVEINALGYRTTTIFDVVGQTSALVDARGNRHSFTYDSTGAQTQLIDPLNRRTTSAYDIAGQQTLRIDARSNRTTFAYNSVSQLTLRKYPDGSRATFSYDNVGNRTLMADSTGRYTWVYDVQGQTMVTASPNSQRHTYSYDGIGTRRSLDASGAGRFTSAYDLAGQLTSLRNPYSERTTFSYDDSGRRTVQRNANGTRVSTAYDAASQTSQVIHRPAAGSPLLQLDYRYDNAGNRKVLIEGGGTARVTWSYDAQNQLTGEHRTGTNAYRQTYTFDPAGNRTLKNLDGTRTTYGYDSANQLRYGQAVAGRTTFQYDLTGNQRIEQPPTGNRTTTTWNYENQPTQYRLPTGSPVTMAYNGDNRRISLQQGASTTKFVWDSVIDAYVKELDGSNIVQAVYTSEPQHYGAVLSQRRGSTSHILHADALGTTRLLTTSAGASSDTHLFDAWGNLITSSGTTVNPFRWVGRYGYYMDQSTGMVYVRARMYVPAVARWASVDPTMDFTAAWGFTYVACSPTSQIDPSGLLLVAVDGTQSLQFREGLVWDYVCERYNPWPINCRWKLVPSNNGRAPLTHTNRVQSHVRNFWQDYQSDPSEKWFHDGPNSNIFGISGEVSQILWEAWNWICKKYCGSGCKDAIDLVGHSRGGHIVNELAHRLNDQGCTCKKGPIPVRFLGMYDPVNFLNHNGMHGSIAPNVEYCSHVLAAPSYMAENGIFRSRRFWPRVDGYPESDHTSYRREMIIGTHSALGGAPWWGDWPPGHSARGDIAAAIAADKAVRERAVTAGSPISLVADYGYAHPGTTPPGSPDSVARRY